MLSKIKYSLILGALLFALNSKGQSTFNTYYPSGSLSSAFKVQNAGNNNFLVSSYYKDNITGQQGLDLRLLDNNGSTLQHKTHLFGSIDFLSFSNNKVQCNISNSTMLLTGGSSTGTVSTVIFASVNKNTLDTNWSKTYKDGIYNYYINHVFKIKPNEIWFMGNRGNNNGYNVRPFIFKTDTLGNILSVKEFTAMINYEGRQIDYDTLTARFYIAGENYNTPPNTTYYVTCIDTTGSIVWNKFITNSALFVYQVKKTASGIICSGGLKVNNVLSFGEWKLNLFKLSLINGNVIWNKLYGKEYLLNILTDFFEQPDGSIICTGSYSDKPVVNASNHDACLLKVNSNGDSLWMKTYGNYGQFVQEYMYDIEKTPDGGYIMCGEPMYGSNTQAWVVKTDSLGVAPGMVITVIDKDNNILTGLKIYPNPANDILNISLSTGKPSVKIEIINSLGQVIREEEASFENRSILINTGELPNGVYLLTLRQAQGTPLQYSGYNAGTVSKRFVVAH